MKMLSRSLAVLARAGVLGLLTAGAVALGWISLQRNVDRACELDEWPHLSSCPKLDTSVAAQVSQLRGQAARNPGEALPYVALAMLTTQPGGIAPLNDEAVLAVAQKLAGADPALHRVLASRAMQRQQWTQAVQWLVRLAQDSRDEAAPRAMAALMALPEGRAAVVGALRSDSRWVEPLLRALPAAGVPVQQAMPLLEPAISLRLIAPELGLAVVSQLKATGYWLDAQALWLRLLGQPVPMIYNGGFEQGFIRGGFDWELPEAAPAHTGVQVAQQPVAGAQGRALELAFNGRALALPVIGQLVVLFPGSYAFTGRFMARRLRAGTGLTWVFSCAAGGAELARTPALTDSQGKWQDLSLPLLVPAGCGAVLMQLRTQVGSDALAGLRGEAYFDDFLLSVR